MKTCNVGKTDRNARILLGLGAIAAGVAFQSWWGALGIILVATAGVRWCPIYRAVGVSTCGERVAG